MSKDGIEGVDQTPTGAFEIWACPGCQHKITSESLMERSEVEKLIREHIGHCEALRHWIRSLSRKAALAVDIIGAETLEELQELISAVHYWEQLQAPTLPIPEGSDLEIEEALAEMGDNRRSVFRLDGPATETDEFKRGVAQAFAWFRYLLDHAGDGQDLENFS